MDIKKHISKERFNKKFCIDCKYHEESTSATLGPWCVFTLSPVDGKPEERCFLSRASIYGCTYQGKNFVLSSNIVIHETEEQTSTARLKEPLMVVSRFLEKLKKLWKSKNKSKAF